LATINYVDSEPGKQKETAGMAFMESARAFCQERCFIPYQQIQVLGVFVNKAEGLFCGLTFTFEFLIISSSWESIGGQTTFEVNQLDSTWNTLGPLLAYHTRKNIEAKKTNHKNNMK
jgi:hypothetical protein